MRRPPLLFVAAVVALLALVAFQARPDPRFALRVVRPDHEAISLHWQDDEGRILGDIGNLERLLASHGRTLLFAMNGGMYMEDQRPLGLYIAEGQAIRPLITRQQGEGNFYLQPNGVFGIDAQGKAFVCTTALYPQQGDVRYATQSGPMLLVDGVLNREFRAGSPNLNIRNGVGIRPNGEVVFGISVVPVNFHDFAQWFRDQDCTDALYLDGAISKAFIPEAGLMQREGHLGPLIAVSAPAK